MVLFVVLRDDRPTLSDLGINEELSFGARSVFLHARQAPEERDPTRSPNGKTGNNPNNAPVVAAHRRADDRTEDHHHDRQKAAERGHEEQPGFRVNDVPEIGDGMMAATQLGLQQGNWPKRRRCKLARLSERAENRQGRYHLA